MNSKSLGKWTKDEMLEEILNRFHYFYGSIDGGMHFPNSTEGDILRMVWLFLNKE